MTAARNGTVNIIIDNERIEPVQDFLFLGSKINRSGESGPEIKRRIALGRSAMQEMAKIWRNKDTSTATKIRMVNATVFSDLHERMRKLDTQEGREKKNRCFRTMVLETNTTHTMDINGHKNTILERVKPKTSLESKITKQQLSYFGHLVRANSLETTLMLGIVSWRRRRGRQ